MLFKTTKKHEEFRKKVREFVEAEVKPITFQLDQNNKFSEEIVKKMGSELNVVGIPYSKEYDGLGEDVTSYAIVIEELPRVDGGIGVILSTHVSLGSYPIEAFGIEERKRKYLVPLAKGEKIGAFGLTEPEVGSDAGGTQTTVVLESDHYILNGGKIFITNAPYTDTYIVFAVTYPGVGTHGVSAFIVEKGWEGFTSGDHYDKLGIRSSSTVELIFNNVKAPKENSLGKGGQGFRIAVQTLDGSRIGIASQALGIVQDAYEAALEYAKERVQFGRPIAAQQINSFKLAEMATKLRVAHFLTYSAIEMKQNHEDFSMEVTMAKRYASDEALKTVNDALQIHGSNGYPKGMEVGRFCRDVKITTIYERINEIMDVVIASSTASRLGKSSRAGGTRAATKKDGPITGEHKREIIKTNTPQEAVDTLVANLKKDGYDFAVNVPIGTPVYDTERVISVDKGIGGERNLHYGEELAKTTGAALGGSKPITETLKLIPLDHYVGMSGQKFSGNLYIACGISGASRHLKGIKNASTIVAIDKNVNAPTFRNCDYEIVGDMFEIMLLPAEALGAEEEKPAPPVKKVRRFEPRKLTPNHKVMVCPGCGYEYKPGEGDSKAEIDPGTSFEKSPERWTCPNCQRGKQNFIEEEFPADRK